MKRIQLISLSLLCSVAVLAQRYTGYGRGCDVSNSRGSSLINLYFILFVVAAALIAFLYFVLKGYFGKSEWTYEEFRSKHGLKVQFIRGNTFIEQLVFSNPYRDKETYVQMDYSCREFWDLDSIDLVKKDLRIKYENGRYIMYKTKGKK